MAGNLSIYDASTGPGYLSARGFQRREQMGVALQVHQHLSPAARQYQRRMASLFPQRRPAPVRTDHLPKVNWAAVKAQGRFLGPRV